MAPRRVIIRNHFFAKNAEANLFVLFVANNFSQSTRGH